MQNRLSITIPTIVERCVQFTELCVKYGPPYHALLWILALYSGKEAGLETLVLRAWVNNDLEGPNRVVTFSLCGPRR